MTPTSFKIVLCDFFSIVRTAAAAAAAAANKRLNEDLATIDILKKKEKNPNVTRNQNIASRARPFAPIHFIRMVF